MRLWKLGAGVAVLAMTLSGVAHAGAPREPNYSSVFVDGGGNLKDDWGENFNDIGNSLCNGCSNSWNTDAVVLWQTVLVAEGYLEPWQIDGKFGPNTEAATRAWQRRHNLRDDGMVGDNTWGKADDHLEWRYTGSEVRYDGPDGDVVFFRGTGDYGDGSYEFVTLFDGDCMCHFGLDGEYIYYGRRTASVG